MYLEKVERKKIKIMMAVIFILTVMLIITGIVNNFTSNDVQQIKLSNQNYKAANTAKGLDPIEQEDNKTESPYVTFDAYFLDGNKKYKGFRQELNEDVKLTVNLNVQTQGKLKNAKIELQSKNFTMINNIEKDQHIKSVAVNKIEFATIDYGTTKTINITMEQGVIKDSDFNKNKLSCKDNLLIFTGTYEDPNGTETTIRKEIQFRIDWYGSIEIENEISGFVVYSADSLYIIDHKQNKVYIIFNPFLSTKKAGSSYIFAPDKEGIIEATIPQLGNCSPVDVYVNDMSAYRKHMKCDYNKTTRKLVVTMENPLDADGNGKVITNTYKYSPTIIIEYPISAATQVGATGQVFQFRAEAYVKGYSTDESGNIVDVQSTKDETTFWLKLQNPKGSILLYNIDIDGLAKANSRIYYEKEKNAEAGYQVDWLVRYHLIDESIEKFVFSEKYSQSDGILSGAYNKDTDHFTGSNNNLYDMQQFLSYSAIRVDSTAFLVLGESGYIDVYDEDTGQKIKQITYEDVNKIVTYDSDKPIKHIRIETSKPVDVGIIRIENFKRIDNSILKSTYDVNLFDTFTHVNSAFSGLIKRTNQEELVKINGDAVAGEYLEGSSMYYTRFDAPNYTFSEQKLNTNTLSIFLYGTEKYLDKDYVNWVNPKIIVEFPETFTEVIYNSFTFYNNGNDIEIKKHEVEKKGNKYILTLELEGVITKELEVGYLKFQSLINNSSRKDSDTVRIFAYNEACNLWKYYNRESDNAEDIYDIDNDNNKTETTRAESLKIYYATSNTLYTSTQVTNFDDLGTVVEGPNVASVAKEANKKVRININVSNGYESAISNVKIVGRIPFTGNKNVINSDRELGSKIDTTMDAAGIKTDYNDINGKYTVYYSYNENATKDDTKGTSGDSVWIQNPDWSRVKSYMIDFGSNQIAAKTREVLYYDVNLPANVNYGDITYATHAIYFDAVGAAGRSTETDKVGVQIGSGKKYNLIINDYKYNTQSTIKNATPQITNASATIEIKGEKYGDTYGDAKKVGNTIAQYSGLYVDGIYVIHQKDISSPYILDTNEIKFRVVYNNGTYELQILDDDNQPGGNANGFVKAVRNGENTNIVYLDIQNLYKYNLTVINKVKDEETLIKGSDFTLTGSDQYTNGDQKNAPEGSIAWKELYADTWKIVQDRVGESIYKLNTKEHKLKVNRNANTKVLEVSELQNLDNSKVSIKGADDFENMPEVYVIIENAAGDAIINANKTVTTQYGHNYAIEGEQLTYKINITNTGMSDSDVTVSDTVPEGTTLVPGSIKVTIDGVVSPQAYDETNLQTGISVHVKKGTTSTVEFKVTVDTVQEGKGQVTITNTGMVKVPPTEDEEEEEEIPVGPVKTPIIKFYKEAKLIKKTTEDISEDAVTAGDEIEYTIVIKNLSEISANNITVTDVIPDGTSKKTIENDGKITDGKIIHWLVSEIKANSEVRLKFTVIVNYKPENGTIKNVAIVTDESTNEVDTPYEKPDISIDDTITKTTTTEKVTSKETKISYTITYTATVRDFVGKAKITLTDKLPYPIDVSNSNLDEGGHFDSDTNTISWDIPLVDVNTYNEDNDEQVITITKNITLKYIYPSNVVNATIDNTATGKIDLLQKSTDPEHPDEYEVTVPGDEKKDDASVKVELPGKVVVHHYFWDESKGDLGATTDSLAPDSEKTGVIGENFDTSPSSEVDPNYECKNPTPQSGTYTEEEQVVIYYYTLKDVSVKTNVEKTAEADSVRDNVAVLTKEDGVVKYHIKQTVEIDSYKGKAKIIIKDILPADIDIQSEKTKLNGGKYDKITRTITWEEERNIDTFATNKPYTETIEKDIEFVYVGQNKAETLINIVDATVTLYYPSNYPDDPGGERITEEDTDTEEVEQNYLVTKEVIKKWNDNGNKKGKRPNSVTVELLSNGMHTGQEKVLNDDNSWRASFENLQKYTQQGIEIIYSIEEKPTQDGELDAYETPSIVLANDVIEITNNYWLVNRDLEAEITKTGPTVVKKSDEPVTYHIEYHAIVKDYKGDAKLIVTDILPYHIDESKSTFDGVYEDLKPSITWEIELNDIDTSKEPNGEHEISFSKDITVVFKDLNFNDKRMINYVSGTIEFYETEEKNTVEDDAETFFDLPGKVVVHYVDKDTGEEITYEEDGVEKTYQYEINGNAGDPYGPTDQKEIPGYVYDSVKGNETGVLPDGVDEVIYYYVKQKGTLTERHVDEDGNDIIPPKDTEEPIGTPYETKPGTGDPFEDYEVDWVEGEPEGEYGDEHKDVIYHYKKRRGTVIVKFLEKETENVLETEVVLEGEVKTPYDTERKSIPGYRAADPEPENKTGVFLREEQIVIYWYEKVSGKIVVKYKDVETDEEILHKNEETDEYEPYRDEQTGEVGEDYETEPRDIPFYNLVEELIPSNKDGKFTEEDKEIVYYYRKQIFNFAVEKTITKAIINGEEQKVLDGKLIKVEIVGSEMENTTVEIQYNIKVSNTGEIAGKATLIERLPEYFVATEKTSKDWKEDGNGNLKREVELEVGETKEFPITLVWKRGSENFGNEKNTAEIEEFENEANYEDNNLEDNKSNAEVIVSVKTGKEINVYGIIYILTIIIAIIKVIFYVKKIKENDTK